MRKKTRQNTPTHLATLDACTRQIEERVAALKQFNAEVHAMAFPYAQQSVFMREGEEAKLLEMLDQA